MVAVDEQPDADERLLTRIIFPVAFDEIGCRMPFKYY